MRQCGKFERRSKRKKTADVPAKKVNTRQPQVKDVLLQTYFTSLLSLVLCVSMFLGTSYAWFTSEVTNTGNEIYVGTLKVAFLKEVGDEEKNLADATNKLFDGNIRWEPGYTALETIQIVNKGDLAFKYTMTFTDGTLAVANSTSLENVAKHFEVWVLNHRSLGDGIDYVKPASYDEINKENNWIRVGNLDEVLNGKNVLEGNMVTVRQAGQDAESINDGTTDGIATVDRYTIAIHMNEDATSDVMGHKITLNVKLVAHQKPSENDAFGNDYDDKQAFADDYQELQNAVNGGKHVIMTKNIIIPAPEYCLNMEGNSLDGSRFTIEYIGGLNQENKPVGVLNTTGGTITNLTILGNKYGRALSMTELKSSLVVTNCTLSGERAFILNTSKKNESASLSFENVTFNGNVSYANAATIAQFKDCTFAADVRPYGDSKMIDCTFSTEGIDISELLKATGEKVELINCTYNGTLIEKAVLTSNDDGIKISETSLLVVNAAGDRIVLSGNNVEAE